MENLNHYIAHGLSALPTWTGPLLVVVMLVALLLMWRWRWRDYLLPYRLSRLQAKHAAEPPSAPASSASPSPFAAPQLRATVVVTACNQADDLRRNLPHILSQNFSPFEVVVVDEASTDDTRPLLEYLSKTNPRLRYTFVPHTAANVDRHKLAITLGIRAARAPWVVLTSADCQPAGQEWIPAIARHFTADDAYDFILGYATYADDGTSAARRLVYERLRRQLMRFRAAQGTALPWQRRKDIPRGLAFGADSANLAIRKAWFMAQGGYADSLTVTCGEDDLLLSALARPRRTAVVLLAAAHVVQTLPPRPVRATLRVMQRETLCHLSPRGRRFLWREGLASASGTLFALALLLYLALRAAELLHHPVWQPDTLPADVAALLLLLAVVVLPGALLSCSLTTLGERRFGFLRLTLYAMAQPWRGLLLKLKRRRHRHDYVRKLR